MLYPLILRIKQCTWLSFSIFLQVSDISSELLSGLFNFPDSGRFLLLDFTTRPSLQQDHHRYQTYQVRSVLSPMEQDRYAKGQ